MLPYRCRLPPTLTVFLASMWWYPCIIGSNCFSTCLFSVWLWGPIQNKTCSLRGDSCIQGVYFSVLSSLFFFFFYLKRSICWWLPWKPIELSSAHLQHDDTISTKLLACHFNWQNSTRPVTTAIHRRPNKCGNLCPSSAQWVSATRALPMVLSTVTIVSFSHTQTFGIDTMLSYFYTNT